MSISQKDSTRSMGNCLRKWSIAFLFLVAVIVFVRESRGIFFQSEVGSEAALALPVAQTKVVVRPGLALGENTIADIAAQAGLSVVNVEGVINAFVPKLAAKRVPANPFGEGVQGNASGNSTAQTGRCHRNCGKSQRTEFCEEAYSGKISTR